MVDPMDAAAALEELAGRYDVAARETYKGIFNPAEEETAKLRDLGRRLQAGGRSAGTRADADFLVGQAASIRKASNPRVKDEQLSAELRADAQAGLVLASRLEGYAEWIRAGFQGRPSR